MRNWASLGGLAVLMLTGCTGTQQVSSNPSPVGPAAFTLPVTGNDLAAANQQAALNCRAQGRTAQLLSRGETGAYYRCQ